MCALIAGRRNLLITGQPRSESVHAYLWGKKNYKDSAYVFYIKTLVDFRWTGQISALSCIKLIIMHMSGRVEAQETWHVYKTTSISCPLARDLEEMDYINDHDIDKISKNTFYKKKRKEKKEKKRVMPMI